jgi:alpha,alpha-trehalase
MHKKALAAWVAIVMALSPWSMSFDPQTRSLPPRDDDGKLRPILGYISSTWETLSRSTATCEGIADNKVTEQPVLYVPADFPIPPALKRTAEKCGLTVRQLPFVITRIGQVKSKNIDPPGLLYLENPYVVPGGRFNEMYGWDSYFIIRGLLRSGKLELAKDMVENFFFEIEHYGAVLNANRTYYLTRSQPPFLSSMIIAVFEAEKERGEESRSWLARAYAYASRDYEMWTHDPHLAGATGLSRYYDFGDGPVPEGLHDEVNYYHDVLAYFVRQGRESPYLVESGTPDALPHPEYRLELCDDPHSTSNSDCTLVRHVALSSEYYKGDRSMRESGFDITFRFGSYGAETHHYAPVCLNSLLYKTETDLEKMSTWLGNKIAAQQWHERAEKRRKIVQQLLWNERRGLFFDYDFTNKRLSSYEYATTFYPLWVGIATPAQARSVIKNLTLFEHKGGLAMSTKDTGVQWDYPYGWAPIQLIAVEGLRRYGYKLDADRISFEFLSVVLDNFERDGNIREKYNVATDTSNIQIAEGYRGNIVGFGWTNGTFLELLNQMPNDMVRQLGNRPAPSQR